MAFIEQAHVGDIGTTFRVTVYDTTSTGGSSVADISTATTKRFTFERPDGTTFNKTAVFTNTGADGQIEYVTATVNDLNVAGTWSLQAYVVTPDGTWNTTVGNFRVYENL